MAEAAGPDEDDALTPGYKAPAKVGIADMMKSEGKDDEDEALQRWKAQLLAGADSGSGGPPVEVAKMELHSSEAGHEPMVLDLTGDISALADKANAYQVKEGTEFHVQIFFKVNGEVVSGLKYTQKTFKGPIKLGSDSHMLGSYGPKAEIQMAKTPKDDFPSGMLARTTVKCVSKFIDDDGVVHKEWTWWLKIAKDWSK
eukprot:gene6339-18889_t